MLLLVSLDLVVHRSCQVPGACYSIHSFCLDTRNVTNRMSERKRTTWYLNYQPVTYENCRQTHDYMIEASTSRTERYHPPVSVPSQHPASVCELVQTHKVLNQETSKTRVSFLVGDRRSMSNQRQNMFGCRREVAIR